MAAHRYWRIKSRQNTTYFSVEEIELRTSAGGADQTTPSTTISLGALQDGAATNAIDNNTGTYCQQSPGISAYLLVDFGAGNEKDIVQVSITGSPHVTDRSPQEFDIEGSDDASTFTVAWSCSCPSTAWTLGGTVVFTKPTAGAHRYWRIRPTDTVALDTNFGISELEFRTSAGGANVATGGTVIKRSENAGAVATNAFDGNTATDYFVGASWDNTEWIGYDWGSGNDKSIVQVAWVPRSTQPLQQPYSGIVESSPDLRSWLNRWTFAKRATSRLTSYKSEVTDPASVPVLGGGAHRYWGIRVTAIGTGGDVFGIAELELHDTVGGSNIATGGNAVARQHGLSPSNAFGAGDYNATVVQDVILCDFGSASSVSHVDEIKITARGGGITNKQAPVSGFVVYSDDGCNLTDAWAFSTADTWALGESRTLSDPAAGASSWVPRIIIC